MITIIFLFLELKDVRDNSGLVFLYYGIILFEISKANFAPISNYAGKASIIEKKLILNQPQRSWNCTCISIETKRHLNHTKNNWTLAYSTSCFQSFAFGAQNLCYLKIRFKYKLIRYYSILCSKNHVRRLSVLQDWLKINFKCIVKCLQRNWWYIAGFSTSLPLINLYYSIQPPLWRN